MYSFCLLLLTLCATFVSSSTSFWEDSSSNVALAWTVSVPNPLNIKAPSVACVFDLCYVVGGAMVDPNGNGPTDYTCVDNVMTFNITSKIWDTQLPLLNTARCYAGLAVVFDDPVNNPTHYVLWLVGGQGDVDNEYQFDAIETVENYDPDIGAWITVTSANMLDCYNPNMSDQSNWSNGGVSKFALAVVNTTIFALGGGYYNTDVNLDGSTMCSFVLETSSGYPTWQILNGINGERLPYHTSVSAGASLHGTPYIVGGSPCATEAHCFRPHCPAAGNDDDTAKDDDDGNPHPQSGPYNFVFKLDYSVGLKRAKGNMQQINWGQEATATWLVVGSLNIPRCGLSVIADEDANLLYAIGGIYEDTVATVEIYNKTADSWSYGTPLLQERHHAGVSAIHVTPGEYGRRYREQLRRFYNGSYPVGIVTGGDPYDPSKDYGQFLNETELLFRS